MIDNDDAAALAKTLEERRPQSALACGSEHFEQSSDNPKVHDGLAFVRFLLGERDQYVERFAQLDYAEDDGARARR